MIRSLCLLLILLGVSASAWAQTDNSVLTRLHPRPQVSWLGDAGSFPVLPTTHIIISDSASAATRKAVSYLQKLVRAQLGDTLMVLPESQNDKMPAIYVGTLADFATLRALARSFTIDSESLEHPESYLLDVQPTRILLLGNDSNAVFDGVSTLAQFFAGPSLHVAILSLHILDWPDYPIRWVFSQHNLQVASQVDLLTAIEDSMAYHKLNGLQQNDFKYNRLESVPDWYFTNVDSLRRHSARTNIEIIPGVAPIGYSEGILLHDPDLAEGFETNSEFVIVGDSGYLITDRSIELPNGGFESHNGDTFVGYGYQDAPGDRTFADITEHHSGNTSMKCTNMTGGNTRVIKTLSCRPHRGYHLSVWAKTSGFSGYFQILAIGTNTKGVTQSLTFTQYAVPSSSDWKQYNVVFNTEGNTQVSVYAGVWGNASGTIWLDDFAIEDAGLTNILRRPTTEPTITVLHKNGLYHEGRDYTALRDNVMEQAAGNYPWHRGPGLHIPSGSSIVSGDTVSVHFWRANPVLNDADGSGSTMVCVSEDTLYSILDDQISRVEQLHQPKRYMMGHDEIRAMNQDSACLSRDLTPAQLLADNLSKCDSIIHAVNAPAPTYVWSDMFDSLHNAHASYYLVNGDLAGDWGMIPNDITIVNWNGKKSESLNFFSTKGFRQITSPYYDVPDTKNMRDWRIAMEGVPNVDGMMYTTWSGDYRYLTPFADYAWSAGPMIVHKPFDSVARAQISFGQYLFINAFAYPDPYDAKDEIDSVLFREWHTSLGNVLTTEVRMTNDSGSRWRAATNVITDPGTDITYELVARNKQGIARTTPRYLLYSRPFDQSVDPTTAPRNTLYPNPAKASVRLDNLTISSPIPITIVNSAGAVVERATIARDKTDIDVRQLPAGPYRIHFPLGQYTDVPLLIVR